MLIGYRYADFVMDAKNSRIISVRDGRADPYSATAAVAAAAAAARVKLEACLPAGVSEQERKTCFAHGTLRLETAVFFGTG
jgi:hypothetical protein